MQMRLMISIRGGATRHWDAIWFWFCGEASHDLNFWFLFQVNLFPCYHVGNEVKHNVYMLNVNFVDLLTHCLLGLCIVGVTENYPAVGSHIEDSR